MRCAVWDRESKLVVKPGPVMELISRAIPPQKPIKGGSIFVARAPAITASRMDNEAVDVDLGVTR